MLVLRAFAWRRGSINCSPASVCFCVFRASASKGLLIRRNVFVLQTPVSPRVVCYFLFKVLAVIGVFHIDCSMCLQCLTGQAYKLGGTRTHPGSCLLIVLRTASPTVRWLLVQSNRNQTGRVDTVFLPPIVKRINTIPAYLGTCRMRKDV